MPSPSARFSGPAWTLRDGGEGVAAVREVMRLSVEEPAIFALLQAVWRERRQDSVDGDGPR